MCVKYHDEARPGHEPWLKISWPSNNQPDLAILKHGTCLSLAYLREIWPLLVLDNWKVITNFLVKAVTQDLLFSGVTAFNSLSADFESRLMPRSDFKAGTISATNTACFWSFESKIKMNRAGEIGSCFRSRLQSFQVDVLKVVKFQLKFILMESLLFSSF